MIEIAGKGFCIFGLRGMGKSWLVKHILDSCTAKNADGNYRHLVYDPLNEHQGYRRIRPDNRSDPAELSEFIDRLVIPEAQANKLDLFIVDEANKYIPARKTLEEGPSDLNDFARHFGRHGLSVGWVARRPVQFNSDILECSNIVFFFKNQGANDYQKCEDMCRGLGDAIRSLKPYHFVVLEDGHKVSVHAPITPNHPRRT